MDRPRPPLNLVDQQLGLQPDRKRIRLRLHLAPGTAGSGLDRPGVLQLQGGAEPDRKLSGVVDEHDNNGDDSKGVTVGGERGDDLPGLLGPGDHVQLDQRPGGDHAISKQPHSW